MNKAISFILKIGKYFSFIFVMFIFIVMLFSFIRYFTLRVKFKVPVFSKDIVDSSSNYYAGSIESVDEGLRFKEERRKIENIYGKSISEFIKRYNLSIQSYDVIVDDLLNIEEKKRNLYWRGAEEFVRKGMDYIKKNKIKNIDAAYLYNTYRRLFEESLGEEKIKKQEVKASKSISLIVFAVSIILFIGFCCMLVLFRIEERLNLIKS